MNQRTAGRGCLLALARRAPRPFRRHGVAPATGRWLARLMGAERFRTEVTSALLGNQPTRYSRSCRFRPAH